MRTKRGSRPAIAHGKTDDMGQRLRFTGTVLLVTAGFFLAARALGALLLGGTALAIPLISMELIGVGALVGALLRAPAMFLSFWSIRMIGTQNYMAAAATLPVLSYALEYASWGLALAPQSDAQAHPFQALLILVACVLIVFARKSAAK